MRYKLIVNQPFTCTANVLAAALHFAHAYDPKLLRLEEDWRMISGGIALHDSFNNQDVPMGKDSGNDYDPNDRFHCFTDGYANYRILDNLTRDQLNNLLAVFNDHYGTTASPRWRPPSATTSTSAWTFNSRAYGYQ